MACVAATPTQHGTPLAPTHIQIKWRSADGALYSYDLADNPYQYPIKGCVCI